MLPARPPYEVRPRRPPSPLSYAIALGAEVTGTLFPNATLGALARGEVSPAGFLPIAVTLRSYGPADVLDANGRGGSFWGWTADAALCPSFAWPRVGLGICLGAGAGTMEGSGVRLAAAQRLVRAFVVGTVAPEVRFRVAGPVWIRAEGGAVVPLVKQLWQFKVDATGTDVQVIEIAKAAPFGALSLEFSERFIKVAPPGHSGGVVEIMEIVEKR